MRKWMLGLMVTALVAADTSAFAENTPTLMVDDLPPAIIKQFTDSLKTPQSREIEHSDEEAPAMWEAASAEAHSELQAKLYFSSGEAEYFILVQFGERGVVVRHSNSRNGGSGGGVKLPFNSEKPYCTFLEGQNYSSMVIAMPSFFSNTFKGIVLCPRDRPENGGRGTLSATDSKFQRVEFVPNASGKGNFRTGLDMGSASAEIITSRNILPSIQPLDTVNSKDPVIENHYKADEKVASDSLLKGLMSGGVMSQVVLKMASGEALRVRSRKIVRVDRVQVPQLLVSAWNSEYKSDAGECLLVSEERDERRLGS